MLTPFAGAGSECVAAKETGRSYIGYEIDPVYVDIANTRLEHAVCDTLSLLDLDNDSQLPDERKSDGTVRESDEKPSKKSGEYQQLSFTLEPIKEGQ